MSRSVLREAATGSAVSQRVLSWKEELRRPYLWLVLAMGLVVFLPGLDATRLWDEDEGFFATKTAFSTIGSLSELVAASSEVGQSIPLELLERVLRVENRVTLPGTVRDNNADEIDGNTLIWEVVASSTREMYAGSVVYRWGRIIGIAVAASVALALLITLLTLVLLRRRRRTDEAWAPGDTPPPPAGPAAG